MLLQLIFNSLVSGLLLSMVAVGFNLIFNTTKVFHLAHGVFFIMGAYVVIEIKKHFSEINAAFYFTSLIAAILVVSLFAFLVEKFVYQPLAKRNAGQAITLISSLGVYIFFINLIALLFSNENKFIAIDMRSSILLGKLIIVPIQIVQLVVTLLLLAGLLLFTRSKLFLKIRAVTSQETVAAVLGVNTAMIRLFAMAAGSALAAIAGILKFYDTGINPYSGMSVTLSAAVAVIIGGSGSIKGTIAASLLICFLQTLTEWFLSAQWKEGMTFILLIAVILWKTEGIVSFKMRVEEK